MADKHKLANQFLFFLFVWKKIGHQLKLFHLLMFRHLLNGVFRRVRKKENTVSVVGEIGPNSIVLFSKLAFSSFIYTQFVIQIFLPYVSQ